MKNNQYCYPKKLYGNRVMGALAVSSLLFVVTGCDSTMKGTKPTDSVVNTASNPEKSSLPDKAKSNADAQADSPVYFIAADASASTPDGIEKVTTEPPRDCRRLNILREYDNEKTNLRS